MRAIPFGLLPVLLIPSPLQALPQAGKPRPQLHVPRLSEAPKIEDFLEMMPRGEIAGKMTKVEGFTQYVPNNGAPAVQPTERRCWEHTA